MKKIIAIVMSAIISVGGAALFTGCSSTAELEKQAAQASAALEQAKSALSEANQANAGGDDAANAEETQAETRAQTQTEAPAETQEETAEPEDDGNGQLGDCLVKIKSSRLSQNMSGEKVIIITYGFTNNGSKPVSFMAACDAKAYQDGVEIERDFFVQDKSYDSNAASKDIKPGKSVDVGIAYTLNDLKTNVDVEVSELISFSDAVVTKTFKINTKH